MPARPASFGVQIESLRPYLLRYATLQLRNAEAAEDAAQEALEACLRTLPERTSRVFMMREHLGLETSEICKELEITATHCWVMLHRARMALRLCLEKNWFAKT